MAWNRRRHGVLAQCRRRRRERRPGVRFLRQSSRTCGARRAESRAPSAAPRARTRSRCAGRTAPRDASPGGAGGTDVQNARGSGPGTRPPSRVFITAETPRVFQRQEDRPSGDSKCRVAVAQLELVPHGAYRASAPGAVTSPKRPQIVEECRFSISCTSASRRSLSFQRVAEQSQTAVYVGFHGADGLSEDSRRLRHTTDPGHAAATTAVL